MEELDVALNEPLSELDSRHVQSAFDAKVVDVICCQVLGDGLDTFRQRFKTGVDGLDRGCLLLFGRGVVVTRYRTRAGEDAVHGLWIDQGGVGEFSMEQAWLNFDVVRSRVQEVEI